MANSNSILKFIFVLLVLNWFIINTVYAKEEVNENLLPNGSFEVTTVPDVPDCWDQHFGRKNAKDWYSLWKIDKSVAFHGKQSLCITVPSRSLIMKLYAESWYRDWLVRVWKGALPNLETDKYYTLSMYLKSDNSGFPVQIVVRAVGGEVHYLRVNTTTKWERYCFTFYLSNPLLHIRIYPLGIGKLWIDAVKLEKGKKVTKFISSPYDTFFMRLPEPEKFNDIKRKLSELGWEKGFNNVLSHRIPKHKSSFYFSGRLNHYRKHIESPSTNSTKVNIDPTKRCILVNGKPFFFFAACFMRAHLYKTEWNWILPSLKEHGYTAVIASFSFSYNDSHASIEEIKEFLDLAHKYGLKVVIWIEPNAIKTPNGFKRIRHNFPVDVLIKAYKEEIKKLIPPLKYHPALLAWFVFDEPYTKEEINSGITQTLVNFARSLDNRHLVYVHYGNLKADYDFYGGRVPGDIISQTQYPIPNKPITYIAEKTALECIAGEFRKPVITALQVHSTHGRYPTPDEFTCMAYLAAIYGATGFHTWPLMPSSKLLWDRVKVVISEMKEISSVLYSKDTVPFVIKGSDYIHAVAKRRGRKVYLFAVNVLDEKQKAVFILPCLKIRKIHVKFENRMCPFSKNRFKDMFKPYERHVYEIDLLSLPKLLKLLPARRLFYNRDKNFLGSQLSKNRN